MPLPWRRRTAKLAELQSQLESPNSSLPLGTAEPDHDFMQHLNSYPLLPEYHAPGRT